MAFRTGNVTLGSSSSISGFGFTPVGGIFTICKKGTSGTDSTVNYSEGSSDGTRKSSRSIFRDNTGGESFKNTNPICHYERVSGTISKVLDSDVTFDSDGLSFTVTTGNANYQVNYKVWS